jgi:hypothetical protein
VFAIGVNVADRYHPADVAGPSGSPGFLRTFAMSKPSFVSSIVDFFRRLFRRKPKPRRDLNTNYPLW